MQYGISVSVLVIRLTADQVFHNSPNTYYSEPNIIRTTLWGPKMVQKCRDIIMSGIHEKSRVGSLWPTVVYIKIKGVYVIQVTLRLVSRISHYSPVTSLKMYCMTGGLI